MSKYDDQYYMAFDSTHEQILYLTALQKSADRRYKFEKLRFGEEPLFFENGYKEEDKRKGIKHTIRNAHMNINSLIINHDIYQDLKRFDIRYLQLYPAVIIDDDEKFHEGYWAFNYYNRLDCVDFEKSIIDEYDPNDTRHDIEKYVLSDDKLDAIPEEERLVFIPARTDMGYTFVHQRIVDIFNKHKVDTIRFIKVSEWEMGEQF